MQLDETTKAEYDSHTPAADRAQAVINALADPVTVSVYDGTDAVMGSGMMVTPWSTRAVDVITLAEVISFNVTTSGTPDENWYLRLESGDRFLRTTFGLAGSGKESTWSLPTWEAGQVGAIGTGTVSAVGQLPPQFTVAPTSSSLNSSGGTIQFTATSSEGAITYSLVATRAGITINASTGLVTVASSAAGTTGNIVVQASDGVLTASATCAVTVASASIGTATYVIPASASSRTLDGSVATGWSAFGPARKPAAGDIIEFVPGTHGTISISNLTGQAGNRITLRSGNGTVNVVGSGFVFLLTDPVHVLVDGTVYGRTYGFLVETTSSTTSSSAIFKVKGQPRDLVVRGVDVNGKRTSFVSAVTPIGFDINDAAMTWGSDQWREDITLEYCRARNTAGEGMYIGPNFTAGGMPFRNMEIAHCIVQNTGRDGINVKGWWEGTNSIHDCTLTNVGLNTSDQDGQCDGIPAMSSVCDIYNNVVVNAGESGIKWSVQNGPVKNVAPADGSYGSYSNWVVRCYNNLVVNAGVLGKGSNEGIVVSAVSSGLVDRTPYIYNNTVVDCGGIGIDMGTGVSGGWIRNNVLVGNGSAYDLGSGGTTQAYNTVSATLTSQYRLTSEIAASGTLGTDISATDLDGVSRAGTSSRGAYEYS